MIYVMVCKSRESIRKWTKDVRDKEIRKMRRREDSPWFPQRYTLLYLTIYTDILCSE